MRVSRAIRWAKWGVAVGAVSIAVLVGVRLYLLDGWLRTVRIDGASMAPALCGAHRKVTCSDCRISFRVDALHLPMDGEVVCPNCGFRELAANYPTSPGDTVLVDRWPLVGAMPRRWDVVAVADPLAGGLAVKRVAGLPGERISIHRGDLFANGRIVRKSLAEFSQVAVLVHDNDHLPHSLSGSNPSAFLRWRPQSSGSGWKLAAAGEFRCTAPRSSPGKPDWLKYLHWRCDASLTRRDAAATILDNDPYNQSLPRRLNVVTDLILKFDARISERGKMALVVAVHDRRMEVEIDVAEGSITAAQNGRQIAGKKLPGSLADRQVRIEFGYCDGQLLLSIDGASILAEPVADDRRLDSAGDAAPGQLSVGAAAGDVAISRLQVWRDQFLLEPNGTARDWEMPAPLGGDQFLLLGDNAPVSIDGRHWRGSGISREQMRGIIVPWRNRTQ